MNLTLKQSFLLLFLVVISALLFLVPWTNSAKTEANTALAPVKSQQDFPTVFWTAVKVAKSMPLWTLKEVQFKEGKILAEARTPSMNFIDDVEIRIEGENPVRVEVKSASRVGISDLGTNARRISTYLKALQKHL